MENPTRDVLQSIIATLSDGDLTAEGSPKIKPLNKALRSAGYAEINAEQRDALLSEAIEERTSVKLIDAAHNPLTVRINGVEEAVLHVGEVSDVTGPVLEALQNSQATIEIQEA